MAGPVCRRAVPAALGATGAVRWGAPGRRGDGRSAGTRLRSSGRASAHCTDEAELWRLHRGRRHRRATPWAGCCRRRGTRRGVAGRAARCRPSRVASSLQGVQACLHGGRFVAGQGVSHRRPTPLLVLLVVVLLGVVVSSCAAAVGAAWRWPVSASPTVASSLPSGVRVAVNTKVRCAVGEGHLGVGVIGGPGGPGPASVWLHGVDDDGVAVVLHGDGAGDIDHVGLRPRGGGGASVETRSASVVGVRSPAAASPPIWSSLEASRMPMLALMAKAPATTTAVMPAAVINLTRRPGCRSLIDVTVRIGPPSSGQPIAKVR